MKNIERILDDHNYKYYEWNGCFDIVASKKKDIFLIKILDNIDSIQEDQANNLKILSSNMSSFAAIIGTHTRRDILEDDIIYERYGIPTITANTFNSILDRKIPHVYRTRGGFFSPIDSTKLRKIRNKSNMSQKELADKLGVTKKFVYEHEKKDMLADMEIVIKLEKTFNMDITNSVHVSMHFNANNPFSQFEMDVCNNLRSIGFITNIVYQTPFNIIAKEEVMIFSAAEDNEKIIRRKLPALEKFSKLTKIPAVVISNKEVESTLPVLDVKDMPDFTINDIKRILKKY